MPLIFARVSHHDLARMVQYLKVENAILRSKLPKVTPKERARLVKYGKADVRPLGQRRDEEAAGHARPSTSASSC